MTIVNKAAIPKISEMALVKIPAIMTRRFPGNNSRLDPHSPVYLKVHFLASDFAECQTPEELDKFKYDNFLSSYPESPEYADFWEIYHNKEVYPVIGTKESWLSRIDNLEQDYFVVEIYSQTAFAICPFKKIAGKYFDKIVSGEIKLLVSMSLHGYHETPDRFYQDIIIKYGIDPKNVTLHQESRDMLEALEIASYKYKLPKFNLIWALEMEQKQQQDILEAMDIRLDLERFGIPYPNSKVRMEFSTPIPACLNNLYQFNVPRPDWRISRHSNWPGLECETLIHKEYEKKFLSFNGAYRIGRSLLVSLLAVAKLLDKGYVSYNSAVGDSANGEAIYHDIINIFNFSEDLVSLLNQHYSLLRSIDNIYLDDISVGDRTEVFYNGIDTTKYYTDTYFSVITETSFPDYKLGNVSETEVGRILSEKTFKAIGMKHPFIIVSNPHVLELLQEIGYKTFHPLIDETYDKVTDPVIRMCMIVNETKKLCELEGDELTHFLTEAKKICDYNYNVLLNKTNFYYPLTE